MVKKTRILLALLIVAFLLAGCAQENGIKANTYSNIYCTLEYPSTWAEPTIYAYKAIFENEDSPVVLNIQALYFDGSLEALLPKEGLETSTIGGSQGYILTIENDYEVRKFYIALKNDTLFQLTFACTPENYDTSQTIIDQIIQSFEFKNFETSSLAQWNKYDAENVVVYYPNDSAITNEIESWAQLRAAAYNDITEYLGITGTFEPIKMFVFDTQEQGVQYGIQLGFALGELNQVYTLHNQTIGHELAHVLSNRITGVKTDSPVLNEGLATHLNMTGIDYDQVATDILQSKDYQVKLLGEDFRKLSSAEGYPLAASFVKYLIDTYGLDTFKACFAQNTLGEAEGFVQYYQKQGDVLIAEWIEHLKS